MASDPYEIPFELDQSKKKMDFFMRTWRCRNMNDANIGFVVFTGQLQKAATMRDLLQEF